MISIIIFRFKEQSADPVLFHLKPNTKSTTLAALLNNAHDSKMRHSFTQGQVTAGILINNNHFPFSLCDVM